MHYIDVILPLPLDGLFTYSVSDTQAALLQPGMRLLVPFGKSKTYIALYLTPHEGTPDFDVKPIRDILDLAPSVPEHQLRLWQWMADYYMCPLGDVFKAALPAGLKDEDGYRPKTERCVRLSERLHNRRLLAELLQTFGRAHKQLELFRAYLSLSRWDTLLETGEMPESQEVTCEELLNTAHATTAVLRSLTDRGFLDVYQREVGRLQVAAEASESTPLHPLSEAQQAAHDAIVQQFEGRDIVLLHGVTSSGKTEVYVHLIAETLARGQQVLYLLPEIALTVQIMQRLKRVFGQRLGIYHSKYSDAERVEIWRKQLSQDPYGVVLGARSAVFLPFQRLGLVIIDEEHESSFKQQDPAPRYHARSAALMLARMYGARTLLGTATPSAESYQAALTGKYGLVRLTTRYLDAPLPDIEIVDVKDLQRRKMMRGAFSPRLLSAMRDALDAGRQVILFQNRRGYAPQVECHACGWVPRCEHCDVALTLHRTTGLLTCHYCGYSIAVPQRCPSCECTDLRGRGIGTEKVEDVVRDTFPDARVARMDLDTTRTRNAYDRLIDDFSQHRTDVLIGTQMVTKGLDFAGVSVVGILSADNMLNYPDFRAYEHAFQMMSQVAGRAGRRGLRGTVILQTKNAQLPVISQVVRHDLDGFFADLMDERRLFRYPPFTRLVYVYVRHRSAAVAEGAATELAARLRQFLGDRVLGPDKPAVARVKELCIRKVVIKLEQGINLAQVRQGLRQIQQLLLTNKRYATVSMFYDVDPV